MAAPSEKLARSLEALKALQDRGIVAIRSSDLERTDREHRNALAARGHYQAFQVVRESVSEALKGANPGTVVEERKACMAALEAASGDNDIVPFTDFRAKLVKANLERKEGPTVA